MMSKIALLAAALALPHASVQAQEPSVPTQEQQQQALKYLQVLISAIQSDKIDDDVKGVLVGCIYGNSLRTISETAEKAFAANPDLDRNDASVVLGVVARICGYTPAAAPDAEGR